MGLFDSVVKMVRKSPEGRKLAQKDPRKLVKREEQVLKREEKAWQKEIKP